MNTILAEQVLAALVSAPAEIIRRVVTQIEPEDFEDWKHRLIFEAFLGSSPADHSAPGSLIQQINRHLLAAGHYRDHDTGLQETVMHLTGIPGHPEQIHNFIRDLTEQRFRREASDYALSVAQEADTGRLGDLDAALAHIEELRRLRTRFGHRTIRLAEKEGA